VSRRPSPIRTLLSAGVSSIALAAGLALVAAVRALPLEWVFRPPGVVLSSNDPYMYRYYVEHIAADAAGVLDLGVLARFPEGAARGEPLTVAALWLPTELLGGSPTAAGVVLAVYPIVSAVVTAALVYLLATRLTRDRRVGLAAVVLFAVIPGHAFRTGLGFADHHAFDYLWLALTALAAVTLLSDSGPVTLRRRRATVGLLGVGVAAQTLAWEAGPLLLAPLAVGLLAAAVLAVHSGRVDRLVPVAAGLWLGAVIAGVAHAALGWQPLPVALTPALLALGTTGLWLGAVAVRRLDPPVPAAAFGVAALSAAGAAAAVVGTVLPDAAAAARHGVDFLTSSRSIAEMSSLGEQYGAYGPLVMVGFAPVFAVPAMAWALRRAWHDADPGWAVAAAYAWFFLGLAVLQRRFVGELAPFVAVFGGLGLVTLLWWLELVRPPVVLRSSGRGGDASAPPETDGPDARADGAGTGAGTGPTSAPGRDPDLERPELPSGRRAFVLGAFGAVFTGFPALYTAEIHSRVAIDDSIVAAAEAIRTDADQRGLDYPGRYVLSAWGRNRVYNYFVSGQSRSYAFAQRWYGEFLRSRDPAGFYEQHGHRIGYVVVEAGAVGLASGAKTHASLHRSYGSDDGPGPGLAHYRALFASEDGTRKAFALVPGATLVGTVDDDSVTAATEVSIPGATFDYRRSADTDDGRFELAVAHPGDYRVAGERVTVPERAVLEGETVRIDGR